MHELSADFINLVTNRIRKTIDGQKNVYTSIKQGRPLDGETNMDRKIAFIKRKVGVTSDVARKIANYDDVATLNLTDNKKAKAENIQGPTVDFMSICFLDLARAASRAVARVVHLDGTPQGTGFMISPSLFLTNQHVIKDEDDALNFVLEFNYEQDFKLKELTKTRYRLAPDQFFLKSPEDELDYSLIAIGEKTEGPLGISDIGFLPLFDNDDKHVKALFVNCIEHPEGTFKQLTIRENRLTAQTENTLIYNSDTRPGASGSPVFNDDWEVLALHHFGGPYRALVDDPQQADGLPKTGNEGIRVSSIVQDVNKKMNDLSPLKASLLSEALSYNFRQPSLMASDTNKENAAESLDSKSQAAAFANDHLAGQVSVTKDNNTITSLRFILPLFVSFQLSEGQVSTHASGESEAFTTS